MKSESGFSLAIASQPYQKSIIYKYLPICVNQMAIFRNPRLWQHSEAGALEVFARAKGFLSLYNNMDKGMGSFFFVYMSMSQVSWIFQLFITISSMLGEEIDFSSALFGISFGLGTMGLVLSVVSVTLALDRSYLELSFFLLH